MNAFEQFLHSLEGEMERPGNYGWFHLMFVGIILVLTVLACIYFFVKKRPDSHLRIFAGVLWGIIFVLEIYKQLIYSFNFDEATGVVTWDYQWYAFPFQLCSSPLYLLPFVAFMKEGKFRDSIMSFLSTFALFGGLAVFFYPNDVFVGTIGINIQTMVHHGTQIITGVAFLVYNRKKLNFKYFFSGGIVYAVMISIAMILNLTVPFGTDETFNMFYISPNFPSTLPILSIIYEQVDYFVFFLVYLVGFFAIAALIFGIACLVRFLKKLAQTRTVSAIKWDE
ncbi:MAG: YwaF family protein [Clostridia bacterium]|nr:YwaF family protein [Clostridia bacterium]